MALYRNEIVHGGEEIEPWIEGEDWLDDRYRRWCGYQELEVWLGRVQPLETKARAGSSRKLDLGEREENDGYGLYIFRHPILCGKNETLKFTMLNLFLLLIILLVSEVRVFCLRIWNIIFVIALYTLDDDAF